MNILEAMLKFQQMDGVGQLEKIRACLEYGYKEGYKDGYEAGKSDEIERDNIRRRGRTQAANQKNTATEPLGDVAE